jgi:hypothetical protein
MKTLSERFKPEVKELFQAESDRFPSILKMVMQELDSKYWVSDLTLGCVATIASISGLYTHLNTNYQGMYMHDTLSSMFEDYSN